MTLTRAHSTELACDSCGRLPHPHKARLTLVKLLAVSPLELALHAAVLAVHPPLVVSVALLALSSTLLVIWVVEPAAMRLLRTWLHAPAVRSRNRLLASPALWRLRAVVPDRPGDLERLAAELAHLDVNVLDVHVHPLERGALDELVVAAPTSLTTDALVAAVRGAGAHDVQVWPTTAHALADGQTRALGLAARVARDPGELPWAAAELLGARLAPVPEPAGNSAGGETMVLPTHSGSIALQRSGEPFTPAERARARELAALAAARHRSSDADA